MRVIRIGLISIQSSIEGSQVPINFVRMVPVYFGKPISDNGVIVPILTMIAIPKTSELSFHFRMRYNGQN